MVPSAFARYGFLGTGASRYNDAIVASVSNIRTRVIELLHPTAASLGYALFLAVNATGVWGGVFPFLPDSIQTAAIMFWFYLALSLALLVVFVASARLPLRLTHIRPFYQVVGAGVVYFSGWAALIAAMYLRPYAFPASVTGGVLLGAGSGMFYLLWQRLFASRDDDSGLRDMVVGFAYASLIYFALYALPRAVVAYLIPLVALPLFSLSLILENRRIDFSQPMFSDSPVEHRRVYRHAMAAMWRSALCMGALALCTGATRAWSIDGPAVGSLVNLLSMGALLCSSVAVLALWRYKGLRLNIIKLYRFVFPLLITAFVLLPLANDRYVRALAAVLYAFYSLGLMLTMLQCAQMSRNRGINPFFAFGSFGGIVYGLHDAGFILGSLLHQTSFPAVGNGALLAITSIYLLALMFFIGSVNFKNVGPQLLMGDTIELMAPVEANVPVTPAVPDRPRAVAASYEESLARLQERYRLSDREMEVVDLVARGLTVPRIASDLFISENTVRTHKKRIYAKLNVHKKQELTELLSSL